MKYKFPVISCISDVLPYIEGHPEFIVAQKEGYQVIQYTHQSNETFAMEGDDIGAAVRRECRGITFDMDGKIIRRPFHKFFNVNEKPETSLENLLTIFCIALDKLDGSMIAPFMINGNLRLGTKMGITETSMRAEVFMAGKNNYSDFMKESIMEGYTPIFEFLDHEIPIVISHPESDMILLAVRDMVTGQYIDFEIMRKKAKEFGIPVVKDLRIENIDSLVAETRKASDIEGFVVRFNDGHMAKVKTDWYVNLHRVKDKLSSLRHTIIAMIDNKMDDVYAIVDTESQQRIAEFEEQFWDRVHELSKSMMSHYVTATTAFKDRKDFAVNCPPDLPQWMRGAIFRMMDGADSYTLALDLVKKNLTQDTKFNEFNKEVLHIDGGLHAIKAA